MSPRMSPERPGCAVRYWNGSDCADKALCKSRRAGTTARPAAEQSAGPAAPPLASSWTTHIACRNDAPRGGDDPVAPAVPQVLVPAAGGDQWFLAGVHPSA